MARVAPVSNRSANDRRGPSSNLHSLELLVSDARPSSPYWPELLQRCHIDIGSADFGRSGLSSLANLRLLRPLVSIFLNIMSDKSACISGLQSASNKV